MKKVPGLALFLAFSVSLAVLASISALSVSASDNSYSKKELEDAFSQRDAAIDIIAHELERVREKVEGKNHAKVKK